MSEILRLKPKIFLKYFYRLNGLEGKFGLNNMVSKPTVSKNAHDWSFLCKKFLQIFKHKYNNQPIKDILSYILKDRLAALQLL